MDAFYESWGIFLLVETFKMSLKLAEMQENMKKWIYIL